MAEEETRQCSNCGTSVAVSENTCPYCGLNLDTGESYAVRVRKSKQDRDHNEIPLSSVLMLPIIAFALAVFAGYMYQRQAESALQQNQDLVKEYVQKLKKVDTLARFGEVEKARTLCKEVAKSTKDKASNVEADEDSESAQAAASTKRSLLLSIRSKAQNKLNNLSK